jgi:hypothetical protein
MNLPSPSRSYYSLQETTTTTQAMFDTSRSPHPFQQWVDFLPPRADTEDTATDAATAASNGKANSTTTTTAPTPTATTPTPTTGGCGGGGGSALVDTTEMDTTSSMLLLMDGTNSNSNLMDSSGSTTEKVKRVSLDNTLNDVCFFSKQDSDHSSHASKSKSFTSTTDQCQYEYGLHCQLNQEHQYPQDDDDDMYAEAVQEFHYEHYEHIHTLHAVDDQKSVPGQESQHDEIMMDWNDPVVLYNLKLLLFLLIKTMSEKRV